MKSLFTTHNTIHICMVTLLLLNVTISFNVFPFLQLFSYIIWGLCCLNFLIMATVSLRKPIISIFDTAIIFYLILLIIFTLINATDIKSAIYKTVEVLLLLMIINYRYDLKLIIKTCAIVLSCCTYLNLLIMLMFPDWMFVAKDVFDSYLLGGNYNQIGCRLICAIIMNLLCLKFSKKWIINTILVFIVSIATLALVGSMTSLSGIILFSVFCLIPSHKLQKATLIIFVLFIILFQITIVFNGKGLHNNPYAVYIIEDVLQKDITFTNRTSLWDSAGKIFIESPIIGYGFVNNDWYISNMNSFAIGPHNFIYSILINGGVVLFTIFTIICILSLQKILSSYDKIATILLMGISTLFFMATMEVYPFIFIFMLLFFTYNYPTLNSQLKIEKKIKSQ